MGDYCLCYFSEKNVVESVLYRIVIKCVIYDIFRTQNEINLKRLDKVKMNKFEEAVNKLIYEINQFNELVKHLQNNEEKMKKEQFMIKPNDSEEKQLKKQEGHYDRMYENNVIKNIFIIIFDVLDLKN